MRIRAVILLPSRSSISTKPVGNRYVCPCAIPFRRWRNRHCILFSSPLRRSMELSSRSVSLTSLCRTALGCSAHISLSRAMFSRVPSMVWLPMKMKEVIPDSFNSFLSSILMEGRSNLMTSTFAASTKRSYLLRWVLAKRRTEIALIARLA